MTGDDEALLARVASIANHGRQDHFTHGEPGRNSRLDGLQAAVLNCRLPLLEADNDRRRDIAARYLEELGDLRGIRFLDDPPECESVFHQMTLLYPERDALREHLTGLGIGTAVHYPRALHQQAALRTVVGEVDAPVAENAAATVLCLPMFAELTDDEVEQVCVGVKSFVGQA